MSDDYGYTSLRVPEDALEKAKKAKKDGETWGDYILRCADEPTLEMSESDVRSIIRDEIESMNGGQSHY